MVMVWWWHVGRGEVQGDQEVGSVVMGPRLGAVRWCSGREYRLRRGWRRRTECVGRKKP